MINTHCCNLRTKRVDFLLFKSALELLNQGKHLSIAGLHEIIAIRLSMNKGLFTERINEAFPGILVHCSDPKARVVPSLSLAKLEASS